MASKIILKKSSVTGRLPDSSDLEYGELALNYADGKLYYKDNNNVVRGILDSAGTAAILPTAGTGITASGTTLNIGQPVGTTDDVTFGKLSVDSANVGQSITLGTSNFSSR